MVSIQSKVTKYQELKQSLNQLIGPIQFSKDINLRLERISHLLKIIGDPQNFYPTIHIGGTSGKGSTATMISKILTRAGYKTGLHTSPHLQIINERYQINNQITPSKQLIELYSDIKPAIDEVAQSNPFGKPSYFEVQVALAFVLFKKENVDVAVVEVGLGGRLDATNVLDAQVAVITNIGLDHTSILGDTIELIAEDKAGIIKPGQTVISGVTQPSTKKIIADHCEKRGATLWQYGENIFVRNGEGNKSFSIKLPGREYQNLRLSLLGNYQIQNAGCALAAVHAFNGSIKNSHIQESLYQITIPGRMEIIQHNPIIILDGAHNPDKIHAASKTVAHHFPQKKRFVIFALKEGKALKDIMPHAIESATALIVTTFETELWESINPELLAQTAASIDPTLEIHVQPDPFQAIELALKLTEPEDLIWVTGSLYLVGNARNYWYPIEKLFEES